MNFHNISIYRHVIPVHTTQRLKTRTCPFISDQSRIHHLH